MATPIVSNQFTVIQLTRGLVALVDPVDSDLSDVSWQANVDQTTGNYYAVHRLPQQNGKRSVEIMHRKIVARMIGRDLLPTEQVDHINHDTLDNRRCNIRVATPTENQRNRGAQKNNTSGYKGVTWHRRARRWRAYIGINGTTRHLGLYVNIKDAVAARKRAEIELYGEFSPETPIPSTEYNPLDDAPIVDFDTPAGRTHADRVVLALRYPSRPDAAPIGAVRKEIAGRTYLLAVYDADVLAALVRMGWRESEPSP